MTNKKIIHQSNNNAEYIPWHLLVDGNSYQRILVIGCDLSFSAISLAKKYDEVYACDQAIENLLILKKRSDSNSIKNIRYFYGFDASSIPFKDNIFDVVFIDNDLSLKTNLIFFAEVWRILKFKGMVYFSAENKFSYKKLQQIREKGINIFSSSQSRERKDKNFGIYGYKKFLKKSGFLNTKIFSLIPNSHEIQKIEDVDHNTFFKIKRNTPSGTLNLKKVVKDSKILRKYMTPCFGIFAKKNGDFRNTVDCIIDDITASLNNGRWEILDSTFQITQKGTFVFKLINKSKKQSIIIKASLNSVARKQLEQNFQQISYLHKNDCITDDIKEIVPIPILRSSCNRYYYYSEELKSGEPAVSFYKYPEIFNEILKNTAQNIIQLHSATSILSGTKIAEQKKILEKKIERIGKILGDEYETYIERVSDYLHQNIFATNLPLVFHKGDCSAHNILVSQNYSISALIDWDQSSRYGFPLIDLINLIESFKRHSLKQGMGNILTDYLFPEKFSALEADLFSQYCNEMNISKKMIFPLCVIYWMEHVTAQDFANNKKWMKNNVFNVMEYLNKAIINDAI